MVTIPLAVAHLDKGEIGLWAVISTITGYLLWLQLGVGQATGRKIADAVAMNDQEEIDAWWTTTRLVLLLLGLVMLVLGLAMVPWLIGFFDVPDEFHGEAKWLLIGTIITQALLGFPFFGYPGAFTAQNRFHWVPVVQSLQLWVNLLVFWVLLALGNGILSYLWAMVVSLIFSRLLFGWLLSIGPTKFGYSLQRVSRERIVSLLKFSTSLSTLAISQMLGKTLPTLILAKSGGLAAVPVFTFSTRLAEIIEGLVRRNYQAFYPGLQRLFVTGKLQEFQRKYGLVNVMTFLIGTAAAGVVLAFNKSMVELLAGPGFYGGLGLTSVLACGVVVSPLANSLTTLLNFSGSMGRLPLLMLGEVILGTALAIFLRKHYGLAGLAGAFIAAPILIRAPYGALVGSKQCGCLARKLCGKTAVLLVVALLAIGGLAILSQMVVHEPLTTLSIHNRIVSVPNLISLFSLALLAVITSFALLRVIREIRG